MKTSTALKIVTLAPMPSPNDTTATAMRPGLFLIERKVYRMSPKIESTDHPPDGRK